MKKLICLANVAILPVIILVLQAGADRVVAEDGALQPRIVGFRTDNGSEWEIGWLSSSNHVYSIWTSPTAHRHSQSVICSGILSAAPTNNVTMDVSTNSVQVYWIEADLGEPDLIVAFAHIHPEHPMTGEAATIDIAVRNIGNAEAGPSQIGVQIGVPGMVIFPRGAACRPCFRMRRFG